MTDLFDALRESHDVQRALCRRLVRQRSNADRTRVLSELWRELEAHAAAEERTLYATILMDDRGLSSARHALHEHHEIEEAIEGVRVKNKSTEAWAAAARELSHVVHHHLHEEEHGFFQVAGTILSKTAKSKLAAKYRRELAHMKKQLAEE
jgi:hypothetical protein